jgi:hypothetical protein
MVPVKIVMGPQQIHGVPDPEDLDSAGSVHFPEESSWEAYSGLG